MLLTYKHTCGLYNLPMQHPERFMKIQKTMAAIKHALGERAIEYRIQTDPSFVEKRNEKLRKNAQLSGLRESIKVNEKKQKRDKSSYYRITEKNKQRKKVAFHGIKPTDASDNNDTTGDDEHLNDNENHVNTTDATTTTVKTASSSA